MMILSVLCVWPVFRGSRRCWCTRFVAAIHRMIHGSFGFLPLYTQVTIAKIYFNEVEAGEVAVIFFFGAGEIHLFLAESGDFFFRSLLHRVLEIFEDSEIRSGELEHFEGKNPFLSIPFCK